MSRPKSAAVKDIHIDMPIFWVRNINILSISAMAIGDIDPSLLHTALKQKAKVTSAVVFPIIGPTPLTGKLCPLLTNFLLFIPYNIGLHLRKYTVCEITRGFAWQLKVESR